VSTRNFQATLLVLGSVAAVAVVAAVWRGPQPQPVAPPGANGEYLFCHWNVENFFDDHQDPDRPKDDREYDTFFAQNPQILQQKLTKLCDALLKLNGGRGPDVLAVVEVESKRAAGLLQAALNSRLPDPALHYQYVLMEEVAVGRHMAPAILSRLPASRGRLLDKHLRIIEGHIKVRGQDLVLIASHWTSRLRGGGTGRDKYANRIYGQYKAMCLSNPAVDVLLSGDFNDNPDNDSVRKSLHATADPHVLMSPDGNPRLLNLFAGKDPSRFGTLYYGHKWDIFDQLLVSPGMLDDRGWSCDPASAQTVNTLYRPGDRLHRPWRFGGPHDNGDRGYSDHFPVTVKLRVHGQG
jgi:endonuclease/exonuclease/phosphatase family metal-dependent hydrolase